MTDEGAHPQPPTPEPPRTANDRATAGTKGKAADKKRKQRVELAGAVIIGIAAVLTALATYEGSQVDGIVEDKNTEAVGLTLLANDAYNDANAERLVERDWVFSWITEAANEQASAEILAAAMPVEVADLVNEWANANQAYFENPSDELIDDPFSGAYEALSALPSVVNLAEGDRRFGLAQCALFEGSVAGGQGDNYGLSTVFLAIALVVGGIAALLHGKAAQTIVLTTATVSLLLGATVLAYAGDENEARAEKAVEFFFNEDGTPMIATDDDGLPLDYALALAIADDGCPRADA